MAAMASPTSWQPDSGSLLKEPVTTASISPEKQRVLSYIADTFNNILRDIRARPSGRPVIILKRVVAVQPYYERPDSMRVKCHIQSREMRYHFPGKNADEAWRFACVGRILGEINSAIREGITITKRDIYYRDPMLFKQQETVDRYVDDIAHTCQVTRRDLNVCASPKGLVAGLGDGSGGQVPTHIPDHRNMFFEASHIAWILVIEKEATFNTLVEKAFHQHPVLGPGLLVTAKGYPDLATRHFLRNLADHAQTPIQISGLFDWDPDGIQILKCYLYGSKRLAQEHCCILPEMKWIGIRAHDIHRLDGATQESLPLSMRDRALARSMLASEEWRDELGEILPGLQEATVEIQRLLMLNRKAEIQILDQGGGEFEQWLVGKLRSRLVETVF
ncbi:Meiotic recombination protein rec12 [Exophiala dermatitidis]